MAFLKVHFCISREWKVRCVSYGLFICLLMAVLVQLAVILNFYYVYYRPSLTTLRPRIPVSAHATNTTTIPHDTEPKPIIVLFTTLKKATVDIVAENTLHVWASMKPRLFPVLYYTNTLAVPRAKELGWTTVKCPSIGDPILPSCHLAAMFLDAEKRFPNADFYGYANGDILFSKGLLDTLKYVNSTLVHSDLFIVGRRSNYQLKSANETIFTAQEVEDPSHRSPEFTGFAIDYFITPRGKYNWSAIPDLVIGRKMYDNFMVSTSIVRNIPVLDSSNTILALHNSLGRSKFENGIGDKDHGINIRKLKSTFLWQVGTIGCAQFHTQWWKVIR